LKIEAGDIKFGEDVGWRDSVFLFAGLSNRFCDRMKNPKFSDCFRIIWTLTFSYMQ
jgi:hypothetical protein